MRLSARFGSCAVLSVATALLAAAPAAAVDFRTPSNLIHCAYTQGPRFLRCDTFYRTRFSDTRKCEHGDYGQGFGMRPRGRARVLCISDSTYSEDARVLRYGRTRQFGPFRCTSRRTGLTCKNRRGHGWLLSRAVQRVF
jgi:hypothetical protein